MTRHWRLAAALAWLTTTTGCAAGFLISPQQEKQIGAGVDEQIEERFPVVAEDDPVAQWMEEFLEPLVAASAPYREPEDVGGYEVEVLVNDDVVNALAAPGGYVYVTTGLILMADSCDELAGVMAHELAHVTERHSVAQIERAFTAQQLAGFFLEAGIARQAALTLFGFLQATTFSRAQEREADVVGTQIMYRAGYNPYGLVNFFEELLRMERERGRGLPEFLSSHPATQDRIADIRALVREQFGARVEPGDLRTNDCIGTELSLDQVQELIRRGELEIEPGTGENEEAERGAGRR